MKATSRWSLPYPELEGDSPDVPLHMGNLAKALDSVAMDDQGALASRPVSTVGSPGKKGRYYYATDAGVLFRDVGTSWVAVGGQTVVTKKAESVWTIASTLEWENVLALTLNPTVPVTVHLTGFGSVGCAQSGATAGYELSLLIDGVAYPVAYLSSPAATGFYSASFPIDQVVSLAAGSRSVVLRAKRVTGPNGSLAEATRLTATMIPS